MLKQPFIESLLEKEFAVKEPHAIAHDVTRALRARPQPADMQVIVTRLSVESRASREKGRSAS